MKVQIEFIDTAGSYNRDFLGSVFPYFAALFDSGMSDARYTTTTAAPNQSLFQEEHLLPADDKGHIRVLLPFF